MKKNAIIVDGEQIVVSKAFYKKACVFGSDEYYALRKAKAENVGCAVVFQHQISSKKTYNGLSFARMEAYIRTQADSEANLREFEAVKTVAKAKGAAYPLTKEWFFKTYPEFKEDSVSESERAKAEKIASVLSTLSNEATGLRTAA